MEQTTLVHMYQNPAPHSPGAALFPRAPLDTSGLVGGEWRGKDKSYFDYASLIDSDSFQVLCRFPDLPNGHPRGIQPAGFPTLSVLCIYLSTYLGYLRNSLSIQKLMTCFQIIIFVK